MLVVSNTSPLSNLAIIDRLTLLPKRYVRVIIPVQVRRELAALTHAEAKQRIEQAISEGSLIVQSLPGKELRARFESRVDPGEGEAIALAEYLKADKFIVDDRIARELVHERGLSVAGLLGELLWAKRHGHIASVGAVMIQLRTEARFFIHPDLHKLVLLEAGE